MKQNHLRRRFLLLRLAQYTPRDIWAQFLAQHTCQALNIWAVIGWNPVVSPLVNHRVAIESKSFGECDDAACLVYGLVDWGGFCGHG
jgi:hypothetical protein